MRTQSSAAHLASQPAVDLVLDRLPNGELAWLRPSSDRAESDDALYVLTDLGRRALAEAALFDAWPTVADAIRIGTCPACYQLQTAPSCAAREHWGC